VHGDPREIYSIGEYVGAVKKVSARRRSGCSTAQDDEDTAGMGVRPNKKAKRPLMEAKARTRPMAKQGAQGSQFR
jgi:hypothetical protein